MALIHHINRATAIGMFLLISASSLPVNGTTFKLGAAESSAFQDSEVLASPKPEIPSELSEQCFKSCCIARFIIKADGKASVNLISSSGCDEVDNITLSTLQQWRFRPAMLNGQPVKSTRRVKIEFEIE